MVLRSSGPLQTAYVTTSGIARHSLGIYDAARIYKTDDAGATWVPSTIIGGADLRVADMARFRSEIITVGGVNLVRASLRYVSTAAVQFFINNITLRSA